MFIDPYKLESGWEAFKTRRIAIDLPGELWEPIPEFESYAVSNIGRVKRIVAGGGSSVQGALILPGISSSYYYVNLRKNMRDNVLRIHRLVAWAFIGPQNENDTINHINGNKLDNRVSNLEYMSQGENNLHASLILGVGPYKLTPDNATEIRHLYIHENYSINDLAERYPVARSAIRCVLKRETWDFVDDGYPPVKFNYKRTNTK